MKLIVVLIFLYGVASGTEYDWPSGKHASVHFGKCKFPRHDYIGLNTMKAMKRIAPLIGQRFITPGHTGGKKQYGVGVCTEAYEILARPGTTHEKVDKSQERYATAGCLQWNPHVTDSEPHVLGFLNDTQLMAGSDWISLEYSDGDIYTRRCSHEPKQTILMIKCNPREKKGTLRMVENNFNKTNNCYFLFELEHYSICPDIPPVLSPGSIICIVFFACVFVYIIIGLIVQRCRGKVGAEQFPNYGFWKSFGNLQGDGCDLVCRCGRYPGASSYNNVNTAADSPATGIVDDKPSAAVDNGY